MSPGFPLAEAPDSDAVGNRHWSFEGPNFDSCIFGFGDGQVASIASTIDTDALRRSGRRADGEILEQGEF